MDPTTDPHDPEQAADGRYGDAEHRARSGASEIRAELAEAVEPMKQKAQNLAEQQKEAGVERIGDVARAVHGAAGELEDRLPRVADYVHDTAARLEGAAESLRDRNLDELVQGFGDFARRQPGTVFGGAILIGFAFSRFLKSSGADGPDQNRT